MLYYFLLVIRILLLFYMARAGIWLVVSFLKCRRSYMMADIIRAFRFKMVRKKSRIVWKMSVFFLLLAAVMAGDQWQNASLTIALTYPEASAGLNPDGSRYNMSNILSDEVLEDAVLSGGFENLAVEDLKSALNVTPANNTSDSVSLMSDASNENEAGGTTAKIANRVTSQFTLEFRGNGKTGFSRGSEILSAVAAAYKSRFVSQYSPNLSTLDISFDDLDQYDYPDMGLYFSNKIQIIARYASVYAGKDAVFCSSETGETFRSISGKAWDLHDTARENLTSYILSNGLSKSRADYRSRLRYDYTRNCNSYRNDVEAYGVRLAAIDRYYADMSRIVFIPTYDTDRTFYMSKTKTGVDNFSIEANELVSSASKGLSTILEKENWMERLSVRTDLDAATEKTEQMMADLEAQILDLAAVAKSTIQDYINHSSNGYILIVSPTSAYWSRLIGCLVIAMLLAAILYCNMALEGLGKDCIAGRDQYNGLNNGGSAAEQGIRGQEALSEIDKSGISPDHR